MFHPTFFLTRTLSRTNTIVRYKFISLDDTTNKAEQLKKWHRDNKALFGPLIDTRKQPNQCNAKNSTHLSSGPEQDNNAIVTNTSDQLSEAERAVMFPSMRNRVTLLSSKVINSNSNGKNFHTIAGCYSKQTAPHEKLQADDRILQIKPYKNDYSLEYPAVTLILNRTQSEESKAALEKWKQEQIAEMGLEEFKKFYQAQMAMGTKFHDTLKRYFTQPYTKLRIEKDIEGVWSSVGHVLKDVSSPKAIESNVVHPVLKYRGIFDAIADYQDKPTLIEWKKSDKPRKSLALTYDNPTQMAAYFGAVNNDLNYKHLKVKNALLVIAYTDGSSADVFHLNMDALREHWAHWIVRLDEYFTHHATDSEKRLKGGKSRYAEESLF